MNWIFYACLATIACTGIYLCCDILSQKYNDTLEITSLLFIFLGFIFSIVYLCRKKTIQYEKNTMHLFGALVAAYAIFVFSMISSIQLSPHSGYVHSIVSFSTVLLFLIYLYAFNNEMTLTHIIGLILAISGLIILVNSSNKETKTQVKYFMQHIYNEQKHNLK